MKSISLLNFQKNVVLYSMLFGVGTHCRRPCVRADISLAAVVRCAWVSATSAGTNADRCIPPIPRERCNMARLRLLCPSRPPRPPTTRRRFHVPTSTDTFSRS